MALCITEAALRGVMTPSTLVARFFPLVLLGGPLQLGQLMDGNVAVCTCMLEISGISFRQLHSLGDLHSFVKGKIPFSEEALLNLSFSQATHKTVTQHVIQGLTVFAELGKFSQFRHVSDYGLTRLL